MPDQRHPAPFAWGDDNPIPPAWWLRQERERHAEPLRLRWWQRRKRADAIESARRQAEYLAYLAGGREAVLALRARNARSS